MNMYNFNSLGKSVCKLTKCMNKFHIHMQILQGNALFSGKIYTTGKKFTRPPVATVATNFKSALRVFLRQFFWICIPIICLDLFVYLPVSVDFVRMDLDAIGVKGNDVFVSGVLWNIT